MKGARPEMKHFTVIVEGKGIATTIGGEPARVGFFTPRWVFAESASAAGAMAIQMVEAEEKYRRLISTTKIAPILEAADISESDPATRSDMPPGYALYREGT